MKNSTSIVLKLLRKNFWVKISILYIYLLIIIIELLSFIDQLNVKNLAFLFISMNLIIFLLAYLIFRYSFKSPLFVFNPNIYLLLICIPICLSFFKGYSIAPNVYDAMTYHLPRIFHWVNQENLDFYYTSNTRQNQVPPLASYIIMSIFSLTENDRFLFLVSYLSNIATYVLIYKVIQLYTKKPYFSYIGVIFFIFSPTVIGFSSDIYVDAFGTFLTILVLYFYAELIHKNDVNYFYYALFLIPLLVLSKSNSAFLASIIYVFMIYTLRQKIIILIPRILMIIILTVPFALPFVLRFLNYNVSVSDVLVTNYDLKSILLNQIKNLLTLIQTPVPILNSYLEILFQTSKSVFGSKIAVGNFEYYGGFYLNSDIGIDAVGNPVLWALSFIGAGLLIKNRKYLSLVLIFVLQLLVLLTVFVWQPWIGRFSLPLLALGSIIFSLALSQLNFSIYKKVSLNILIVLSVIYGSFWLLYQPGKSLLNPKSLYIAASKLGVNTDSAGGLRHDLLLPRSVQYFAFSQKVQESYIGAINLINENSFKGILLITSGDDIEFPIWSLTNYEIPIMHIDVKNIPSDYLFNSSSYVVFCTTNCSDLNFNKIYESEFVNLYH